MANGSHKPQREWYSISVASVRRALTLVGLVAALIGGSLVYQRWEYRSQRPRAEARIQEASELAGELERRADYSQLRIEHRTAWDDLKDARKEFAAERYGPALGLAQSSLREFDRLFRAKASRTEAKSRFLSVQGGVSYRRGERGTWTKARTHDSLSPGDWVKTSAEGTAEIRFPDDSTYILRPNTLVRLGEIMRSPAGGTEQVTDIHFGWVDLNTGQSRNKVKTPKSEAKLLRDTEATVSYDKDRAAVRYTAYEGQLEVVSASGQTREVNALQQVEQTGDELSEPRAVLAGPRLTNPANDQEIDFDSQKAIRLAWQNLPKAQHYTLVVSRSPIFAGTIIEDTHRRKASAQLGVRGEGIFYWRVAGLDRNGVRGAWSETRSFRVASLRGVGGNSDKTPPDLVIDEVQAYGSLVLVSGRTEPGADVVINREKVTVEPDGSFRTTLQMSQIGFAFIEVVAKDSWENARRIKRRVFVDAI